MADTLYGLARILRSKNSGPFEITLDVLFDDADAYRRVKDAGIIDGELTARLYCIPITSIQDIVFFDAALGIKITYLRDVSSGTVGDRDVYGAQQHAPLMDIEIP